MAHNPRMQRISVQIEKGQDPSCLIIAFTGFQGNMTITPFQFFGICELLKYSRLMLRDPTKRCFLGGAPPQADGFEALLDLCGKTIRQLAPETVLAIGTSGGAFAAMLYGHLLKVDYVHAFSPYTYVDKTTVLKYGDEEKDVRKDSLEAIWALPEEIRPYFNLREVLAAGNGRTRFFVHACKGSKWDMIRAAHVGGCPNVFLIQHQCASHLVASYLARQKRLEHWLRIETQPALIKHASEIVAARSGK